jgi:hypothetical protein
MFGDEPIKSVIPDKIKSTSKIKSATSISSESSTTVESVEDEDDAELEKLVDSTEDDLDDVIAYKSLSTVTVPDFVVNGIATSDILGDDYYGDDHENNCDATVTADVNKIGNNESIFYDKIRAQMDGGPKISVTNLLMLLHNVKLYSSKFKCKIRTHGARSKTIIQPLAEGYLRVPVMTSEGDVDVLCYIIRHNSHQHCYLISVFA